MSNSQNNRAIWLYGAAALSLALAGSGIAYYILEDDKQAKRRRAGRRAERTTLRLLHQIKEEQQAIALDMEKVEGNIDDQACDDKAFKQKEYTLAHSNELLLRLMEKLDAIRPLTVVMGGETEAEPNEFERNLVSNIKAKKRTVIESIEGLFRRLDVANGKAKKESSRREQVAKEKERLEKEEAERLAREEKQREEIRKENERKAKEEQERIAQEEALLRQKEEEANLQQEILNKQDDYEQVEIIEQEEANEPVQEQDQEQAILAAMKEVEQEDENISSMDNATSMCSKVDMIQTQPREWRDNQDEAIDMTLKSDQETDWKIVGSRSRKGSFSVGRVSDGATASHHNNHATISQTPSLINQPQSEFKRRGSACSEKQWGSFGGFQWEGPSIFDEDSANAPAPRTPLPPHTPSEQYFDPNAILSTPMLPHVSIEPIFRQQRSLSFSMGQDPAFFGYDDYHNARNTSTALLTPTVEEEEESDTFDDAYLRSRSQSSNAAFGMYPNGHWMHTHRRGSLGSFMDGSSSKDLLLLSQRRMSQPAPPLNSMQEYSFPDLIPNGGPTHGIISSSSGGSTSSPTPFLSASSTSSIQPLSDYLDIHRSSSSSILPCQTTPETSISAAVITNQQQQQDIISSSKGLALQRLPPHIPLFMVEFKSGRTDFYYVSDPSSQIQVGDLVLVEADRGKDLGKVATDILTVDQVLLLQQQQKRNNSSNRLILDEEDKPDDSKKNSTVDSFVKKIYRKAASEEISLLLNKEQDEQRALAVCLQKIKSRKLPMEVVNAEFQWDRRKLTFYFIAERRIDFRELVRELFKIYKTRIWMCAVNPSIPNKSVTSSM
ncbi:PSP1-domain-containing protein [Mucor ambiguus]|uniref:PSP1-domain-containing protein n=1 Tax=Mucor ambiguus TaxID=91626 RepID=A0A0C9LZK8_9FUNG|nr:PSP1-domain-containing protein [Mucor ambiguus]